MQPDILPLTKPRSTNWLVVAGWIWCLACIGLLVRTYVTPKRNVHVNYISAGQHWLAGTDAYELRFDKSGKVVPGMGSYRYSPLFSAAFAPLSMLPDRWSRVVWRLINCLAYLAAMIFFFREVMPGTRLMSSFQQMAWWVLVLPLSLPSMNNGQANVLMLALMLAAATAVVRERWNLAALALAGAFFLKLYPLALAMLFVLVYPRQLGWRFALALLAGLVAPFACQDPRYVCSAYQNWYDCLCSDVRNHFPMALAYRDFYLLTRWVGHPLSETAYAALQMTAAGGVAAVCLAGRWTGWTKQYLVHSVVLLGCCWLIVFGPATESSTFILLAPGTAWAALDALIHRRSTWTRTALAMVVVLVLTNSIAHWFADSSQWCFPLLPLAALAFFLERSVFVLVAGERVRPAAAVRARAA